MPADAPRHAGPPRQQLASIAAVTDELDRHLDDLFASVARLKEILVRTGTDTGEGKAGEDAARPGP